MEDKRIELLRKPARCNAPSELAEALPNFMTAVTAINDGNLAVGKKKFEAHLQDWLADTKRCVMADPYIFKSGSEGSSEMVGSHVKRVDFYFRPSGNA